ncbi:hypothetical protein JW824_12025 [bacterium]|nr:hypothetical protein [bacterium]
MKLWNRPIFFCCAMILICTLRMPIVVSGQVDGDINRSFDVQPGGWLELESEIGSIQVQTDQKNRVEVQVLFSTNRGGEARLRELLQDFNIDFQQTGNRVLVKAEYRNGLNFWNSGENALRVRFVCTVPSQFNCDLETSGGSIEVDDLEGELRSHTSGGSLNFGQIKGFILGRTSGGSITLSGCEGEVDVQTSGGSIRMGRVDGDVLAKTSGGSIDIEEVRGTVNAVTSGGSISSRISKQPEDDCELRTSGGRISVYVEPSMKLNIDAKTSGGGVETDLPVTVQGILNKQSLVGKINGGGPQLVLRTSGGSIYIRKL